MAEETVVAKPVAVHVRKDRTAEVPLDWPVEFDGKIWDKITVHRMTAKELQDFFANQSTDKRFPLFDAPTEVLDLLDAEDNMRLEEVAKCFLPRKFVEETGISTTQTPGSGASS